MAIAFTEVAKGMIRDLNWKAAGLLFRKRAYFPAKHKVVSFTFDDFPVSAIENGARILESYGVRGTFYAALGIGGQLRRAGKIASRHDMLALSARGHEVACHTFGHIGCTFKSPRKVRDQCVRNGESAKKLGGVSLRNFAYPYGSCGPLGKFVVSSIYNSARSVECGINVGVIDLALLRSVALYDCQHENVFRYIEKLDHEGGWLIFLTHDVAPCPSAIGCSTEMLKSLLESCKKRDFRILTVRQSLSLSTSG